MTNRCLALLALIVLPGISARLPAPRKTLSLRGGVVKIGSGSDFLDDVKETPIGGSPRALEYGGVPLIAMGKKK